jgi:outer membrane protein assembly factor BamA
MTGLFFHESEEDQAKRLEVMQDEDNIEASRSIMPPNVSAVFAAYTGNQSYFIGGGHLGFFKQGRVRYLGGGGYGDVDIDFYGFADISLDRPVTINTSAKVLMQNLKFKLGQSAFYVGPIQRYVDADVSIVKANKNLTTLSDLSSDFNNVLSASIVTSGAGFTLEYDSRNNFFSPTSGFKYEFNYLWFDKAIGSDIDYNLIEFSALNYFKLSKKWRTALRIEADYVDAEQVLPPFATPSISLRGIPSARYQGQSVAMTEVELAYKINFRWEVSAFAGIGKTSDNFSELSNASSRTTKGLGIRYLIARRYDFNMGIDIAKGPEDSVFYIQAGSAW